MKNLVLLSSGSLSNYGTDRVFDFARLTGFDGVEIIVDARTDTVNSDYLNTLRERHGLPVPVIHTPFIFVDPPGWEKDAVSRIKRSLRLAEEVEASILVLHTPFFTDRAYRRWLEGELAEFQETTGVILAVENMPHCRKPGGRIGVWLKSPSLPEAGRSKLWKLLPLFLNPPCFPLSDLGMLSRFDHIILDTTHLATGGFDPAVTFDRIREKVVHIHLSNFDGREHVELSQGVIDIPAFIRHVKASGYRGMFCLEVMPEHFPSQDETYVRHLLRMNLKLIRQNLGEAES